MIELRKNKLYAFYMYTVEAHLLHYRKDFIFFLMIRCFLPIYLLDELNKLQALYISCSNYIINVVMLDEIKRSWYKNVWIFVKNEVVV